MTASVSISSSETTIPHHLPSVGYPASPPTAKRATLAALLVLVLFGAIGSSQAAAASLSKADARLEANSKAYEFASHKTWTSSVQVGGCRRKSPTRVNCSARVTGDEFKGCEDSAPYDCHYVFHRCGFTVAVHAAGYFPKGQIRGVRCRAREHSG